MSKIKEFVSELMGSTLEKLTALKKNSEEYSAVFGRSAVSADMEGLVARMNGMLEKLNGSFVPDSRKGKELAEKIERSVFDMCEQLVSDLFNQRNFNKNLEKLEEQINSLVEFQPKKEEPVSVPAGVKTSEEFECAVKVTEILLSNNSLFMSAYDRVLSVFTSSTADSDYLLQGYKKRMAELREQYLKIYKTEVGRAEYLYNQIKQLNAQIKAREVQVANSRAAMQRYEQSAAENIRSIADSLENATRVYVSNFAGSYAERYKSMKNLGLDNVQGLFERYMQCVREHDARRAQEIIDELGAIKQMLLEAVNTPVIVPDTVEPLPVPEPLPEKDEREHRRADFEDEEFMKIMFGDDAPVAGGGNDGRQTEEKQKDGLGAGGAETDPKVEHVNTEPVEERSGKEDDYIHAIEKMQDQLNNSGK